MNLKIGLIILVIIGIFCCKVAEPLSLDREDFTSDNLRIDGFYYHCDTAYCHPFFLFQNGLFLSFGLIYLDDLNLIDSIITDVGFLGSVKNTQYGWGVFLVKNDNIIIERWLPGVGGPYPTQLLRGLILNDTTIAISGLRGRKHGSEIVSFKFRYLEQKPDSTNAFIE